MGPSGRTPPGQSPGPRKGLTQNPSTLRFPSLAPRYRESTAAGNDVFHKFSAFIKNPVPALDNDEEGPETRRGWGEWRPRPAPHRAPRPQPCTSICCALSPSWTATCARPWSTSWRGSRSCASHATALWTATSSRWSIADCCPSCTS